MSTLYIVPMLQSTVYSYIVHTLRSSVLFDPLCTSTRYLSWLHMHPLPARSCPLSFASNNYYHFEEHEMHIRIRQDRIYMHIAATVAKLVHILRATCVISIYLLSHLLLGKFRCFVKAQVHSINQTPVFEYTLTFIMSRT